MKKTTDISVWVVDDNKPYCVILSEVINKSPSIRCKKYFTSAKAVIEELGKNPMHPNVILLDIMMPNMSGLEAMKHIFSASPQVTIIMLTSVVDDEGVRSALRRGAKGYLLKTSSHEDILRSIEQCACGGMPVDPMVMKTIIQSYTGTEESLGSYHLSEREMEILEKIASGFNSNDVSKMLKISYYTVETHLKNIFKKLDVPNRHAMVAKAVKEGLV